MNTQTTYSIICPLRNEIEYVNSLCSFLLDVYPKPNEMFFVDGDSDDGTKEYLTKWCDDNNDFHLIENLNKTVPFALNAAIPKCTGDIIVRIDAHSKYGNDYFEKILETINTTEADIVGGPTRTVFNGKFQESVSYIFNTSLGMGNSSVHNIKFKGFTDSVTFGAWKKGVFDVTGYFDETLKRNQDDEFHYRAKSFGLKIFQNPDIRIYYYPRSNAQSLFKQYFEYGLYKPIVLKKIKSELKLRHIIPSLFVLYIFALILSELFQIFNIIILLPIGLYFVLILFYTLKADISVKAKMLCFLTYPIVHLAYGFGFIVGLQKSIVK